VSWVRRLMKKALPILLKLAVTTGLLVWIFCEHRFTESILPHLQALGLNWAWLPAGLTAVGLSIGLAALRWQVLLRGQGQEVPTSEVLRVTAVSHFFNITSVGVVGGDAYRVLALMQRPGLRQMPIVASVMLDHLVGMIGVAGLFLSCRSVYEGRLQLMGAEVRKLVEGFEMFMTGSLVFLVLSVISFTPRLYHWGEGKWPWMLGYPPLKDFVTACDALRRNWRGSLVAGGLSVLLFLTHFTCFYCAVHAVGGRAPLRDVLAAMPIVDALAGLPISVSGLGVREKTFETLMHGLTGLPEATAVSASLLGWLMGVTWGLLGGLLFLRGSAREKPATAIVRKH